MGNVFGRGEIARLKEQLAEAEQKLQAHRDASTQELAQEQRLRAEADGERAACEQRARALETDLDVCREQEARARETAARAQKARDEHALMVKRILTAQQKYGVAPALPGLGAAAAEEADRLARTPSRGALARVAAASSPGTAASLPASLEAELEERAMDDLQALVWGPRLLGAASAQLRTRSLCAFIGADAGGGGAALSPHVLDRARVSGGYLHRLPFGALGAAALYDPASKGVDDARLALVLHAPGERLPATRVVASVDHRGEVGLAHHWRPAPWFRVCTDVALDANDDLRVTKLGSHVTFRFG